MAVKLITLNSSRISEPDDPSLPFKAEASLSPPEFMKMTFLMLIGNSEIFVARADTTEELEAYMAECHIRGNPRLRELTITGPDGVIEHWSRT